MKTFKELKQQLNESGEHTFGGGFGTSGYKDSAISAVKDYGSGTFELGQDENLNRVNAFLNAFFQREFVDYKDQMGGLKIRLNTIGIDFDDAKPCLNEGPNRFMLNRYGGTFGKNISTPHNEFERTNGFNDGMEYVLQMDVNLGENNLYKINAKIVREALSRGETSDE
jgi:hypothetical protein